MARHSDGKNNYAFAPWVIIVAILAVLALAIGGFFLFREGDSSNTETVAADTTSATSAEETPTSTEAKSSESELPSSTTPTSENKAPEDVAPNTLFLLDTSDNLAPYFDTVTQGVAEAASAVGAKGSQVALWNYSSPISATATVGFRQNVAYGDAENVAFAVGQFGTGGVPQTRSAVVAALDNATDQTAGSGENTRVVLITTGTQQDMDDASFAEAAKNARGEGVSLTVVHIGDAEKDVELEKLADVYSTVSNPSDAQESITSAAGA
ncbi:MULTISPECIES: vWA domain-containing protein [unclassified Corynebacterium]|uniref:vWA domain-containing protein n=1 Tax=unclassified Corynebacterium TaxID=2624378 RepID=UPI0008A346AE|nr:MULTISPECIES: vWA domain-containing protein [unclassified Corynebacterium]OFN77229.1 hypothetical protein HMPREF2537_01065 [Corynebacterium sp. HMSC074E01]OFP64644.1 hypothetical protein HMPREF2978_00410 [Corynebacterium sp. HMSC074C01]